MNEQMQEIVTLYSAGAIPGIPGEHGAGTYLVDWNARTITPVLPSPQGIPTEPLVQEPVQPEPTPVQEPLEEPPSPVQDVPSEREREQEEDTQQVQTSVQANNSPSIQGG